MVGGGGGGGGGAFALWSSAGEEEAVQNTKISVVLTETRANRVHNTWDVLYESNHNPHVTTYDLTLSMSTTLHFQG